MPKETSSERFLRVKRKYEGHKNNASHKEREMRKIMGWPTEEEPKETQRVRLMVKLAFDDNGGANNLDKAVVLQMIPFVANSSGKPIKEWQKTKSAVISVTGKAHSSFDERPANIAIGGLKDPHNSSTYNIKNINSGGWKIRRDHKAFEFEGPIEAVHQKKTSLVNYFDFESAKSIRRASEVAVEGLLLRSDPKDKELTRYVTSYVHDLFADLDESSDELLMSYKSS